MAIKKDVPVLDNIVVVLKDAKTGRIKEVQSTHNRVTTVGLRHIAQKVGVTHTVTPSASGVSFNFTQMTVSATIKTTAVSATFGDLVTAGGTSGIPTGGTQNFDTNYPTTSDTDGDNTGSGSNILTFLRTYTSTQGNTFVKAIVINQTGAATGGRTSTNFLYAAATLATSVEKTSSDSLKVFANYTFQNA